MKYLVKIHEKRTFWSIILKNSLGFLVKSFHLVLGLSHNPLQSTQIGWWSTFVEQVDIDVVWDRVFALVDSLEQCRLSTTVFSQETISATICKFHGGICEQDTTVENEGDTGNLYMVS